ncbi:hypothetical protein FB567DRAFT_554722 [Paraphoma chrysanthemicola]|uniref:Uncharacterized protein n=1 Tax=Paraphoma chrysanthemicola TaxID=798071 RepID=A0A8K0VSC4_9PLEO|nr:hypothetical protein FB567DRAFT_554722 [Paraphoma chrysanthemicola]
MYYGSATVRRAKRQIQLNDAFAFGSFFVVGIALTANHAALSCKHTNGSFEDLGRIDGTAEYIALIRRLSSWDSWHPHPPYRSLVDLGNDYPRQMRRRVRKAAGLPASADTAILASIIKSIMDVVGKRTEIASLRTAMGSDHSPDEIEIRNHVIEVFWDVYMVREPDDGRAPKTVTVLIIGSSKSLADGRAQNATRTAVLLLHSRIEMLSHNPEYIAARGAVELAWRALKSEEDGEL